MSSAGHVLDSIKRMQANRRLQRHNKNAYRQRIKDLSQKKDTSYITPEDLAREPISYHQFVKQQNRQRIISLCILLLIIVAISYVFLQ